jgi:hypothetical protein
MPQRAPVREMNGEAAQLAVSGQHFAQRLQESKVAIVERRVAQVRQGALAVPSERYQKFRTHRWREADSNLLFRVDGAVETGAAKSTTILGAQKVRDGSGSGAIEKIFPAPLLFSSGVAPSPSARA